MNSFRSDILVVGGGPAGMAAAISASENDGLAITVVDDNPRLGGQIWRAELGRTKSPEAMKLIRAIESGRIRVVNNIQVVGQKSRGCLHGETPGGTIELGFEKLVIATGARERFLPFPGWTLPNVCGAGGLQALVKGGLPVKSTRIVVAGTGALLLAVADYLKKKGAVIAAIVEQAPAANIYRFGFSLLGSPSKSVQAAVLKARLFGVPYFKGCWVRSADGTDRLGSVELEQSGRRWTIECEYLACGYHLVPNIELALMLGCKINGEAVWVDDFQRTSCENIYCAGEPTGIGGVDASLVEGQIAGFAASGRIDDARALFARRGRSRRFGDSLNRTFALRDELRSLATDDTIVCRCEDITYGRMREFETWRSAKLQARCGMGACQGRICGAAAESLFGWGPASVRPPLFPVRMENL